jgi:hypothetical protein
MDTTSSDMYRKAFSERNASQTTLQLSSLIALEPLVIKQQET